MENYKDLAYRILLDPDAREETRSGKTISRFGESLTFDLAEGFPLLTTKYINFDHIKHELKWYLLGTPKIDYLTDNNIRIWNAWADEENTIGPTYGVQWRDFQGVKYNSNEVRKADQIQNVIHDIRHNPTSRRLIINGWNPIQLEEMALPPCLVMMQFHVDTKEEKLHLTVTQRSADMCLGVPYDIAEMALLLDLIANITYKTPGKLTMQYGDIHIYEDHIPTLKKQLANKTKPLPRVIYNHLIRDVDDYKPDQYNLMDYPEDLPKYRYKVAI